MFRYGPATKTNERRSLAYDDHDRALRVAAKSALKYPPVIFAGVQAHAVAMGFKSYVERTKIPVWACAILPDHVHMVIGRPHVSVEQLIVQLKGEATQSLERRGLHPMAPWKSDGKRVPKCWARGEWKVFLDPEDVALAVEYVEENPVKEGKRKQVWSFVSSWERGEVGWCDCRRVRFSRADRAPLARRG